MTVTETALAGLLRIADLSAAQLSAVLELGDEMRSGPGWWTGTHADGSVTCLSTNHRRGRAPRSRMRRSGSAWSR